MKFRIVAVKHPYYPGNLLYKAQVKRRGLFWTDAPSYEGNPHPWADADLGRVEQFVQFEIDRYGIHGDRRMPKGVVRFYPL